MTESPHISTTILQNAPDQTNVLHVASIYNIQRGSVIRVGYHLPEQCTVESVDERHLIVHLTFPLRWYHYIGDYVGNWIEDDELNGKLADMYHGVAVAD